MKSQRKIGDGWGGKIVASVEKVTDKPSTCQGICEEPAPGGAGAFSDRSSCLLQGPSAAVVTAEPWTPEDPQAPSETGGQARAEILTKKSMKGDQETPEGRKRPGGTTWV